MVDAAPCDQAEIETLFSSEANGRRIALSLIELTTVDQDSMGF